MRHHSSLTPRRANIARCATVLLFLGCPAGALLAQDSPPPPPPRGGLQVRSVSAYFDYYANGLPDAGGFLPSSKSQAATTGGGSLQLGWLKSSERTTASFNYASSYTGGAGYSGWNAWSQTFAFTNYHKFAPRWTFGFAVSGDVSNQEQSLFSATTLSNVAAVPATFNELASAMLAYKFTNPQLTAALTSAPLVDSPLRNLLYGQRMFTAAAQTSLDYSYSPRLLLSFQAGASRNQNLSDNQPGASRNLYLIPNATSSSFAMRVSYSLSPATQLGGIVTSNRSTSTSLDAFTTTSLATLGRTLGQHWIMQLHGGVGVINSLRQTLIRISSTPHPALGGNLGFKTPSQIFLGSFDRAVSDTYGLGAGNTSSAALIWRWNQPGRRWTIENSLNWQMLQGNGLEKTSGWRATIGLGRTIAPHMVLFTQYVYQRYAGQLQHTPYSQEQSAVRVSMAWKPHPEIYR